MRSFSKLKAFLAVAGASILAIGLLIGFDYLSYDRTHFAQEIETRVQRMETEAMHQLQKGDWISQLRSMQRTEKHLSNTLISQIEPLSRKPYTIYLYDRDTLLFWSKPGP